MKQPLSVAEAEQILQTPPIYDEATIRFCYANAMRADHPDHGGTGGRIEMIRDARNLLLEGGVNPTREVLPCRLCKGSGRVRSRFGVRACVACEGTGDRL